MASFLDAIIAKLNGVFFTVSLRFSQTGYRKETKMPPKWTYFSDTEVEGLQEDFIAKLDLARKFANIPFEITSGFRSPEKEQSLSGGVPCSAHTLGLAVDLRASNDHEAYLIVAAGISVGITRFGIYVDGNNVVTHVHLDDAKDDAHVSEVIWIRKEGAPYNTAPASA